MHWVGKLHQNSYKFYEQTIWASCEHYYLKHVICFCVVKLIRLGAYFVATSSHFDHLITAQGMPQNSGGKMLDC